VDLFIANCPQVRFVDGLGSRCTADERDEGEFDELGDQFAVMLLIPDAAQTALVVFQLVELFQQAAASFGRRLSLSASPIVLQPMYEDLPQPTPECPGPLVVAELGQLLRNNGQHLLNEIICIGSA